MKTSILITFSLLLCASAILHMVAHASSAAPPDAAGAAIAAQSAAFTAALDKGDATAAAQIFSADARLSVSGTDGTIDGREAIARFWQGAFASGMQSITLTTRDLEGEGDMRIETGTYAAFDGSRNTVAKGEYLLVWKQVGGRWSIYRDYALAGAKLPAANPNANDRELMPRDYAKRMHRVRDTAYDEQSGLTTVFANDLAASAPGFSQQHYPHGAVIIMEFARPLRDGEGELLRDAGGALLRGPVEHVDVMRRGPGLGASYGDERAGEWEFASFHADGSVRIAFDKGGQCAACHRNAGADKDFVFRTRPWSPG